MVSVLLGHNNILPFFRDGQVSVGASDQVRCKVGCSCVTWEARFHAVSAFVKMGFLGYFLYSK